MKEKKERGRPRSITVPEELENLYGHISAIYDNVTISKYAGKYRIYYTDYVMDERKKRKVPLTVYLGWVDNGRLVPPRRRSENAREKDAIKAYEKKIAYLLRRIDNLERQAALASRERKKTREFTNALLTYLSMNSRARVSDMARAMNAKQNAVAKHMHILEKRFGIHYTVELDIPRMGFTSYLMLGKFEKGMPSRNELIRRFKDIPNVQLAFLVVGGEYDIGVYYMTENNTVEENGRLSVHRYYEEFMQIVEGLGASWSLSPIFVMQGPIPVREKFFDMLKKRIAYPKNEREKLPPTQITYKKFVVLKELFENARQRMDDINKKCGFKGSVAYNAATKLLEDRTILWYTLRMSKPPIKYIAMIEMELEGIDDALNSREKWLKQVIEKTEYPTNKYIFAGEIHAPFYGTVLFAPIYSNMQLEKIKEEYKKIKGTEIRVSIITDVLVGAFPIRKFDEDYSFFQSTLIEEYWRTNPRIERRKYYE